MTVTALPPAPLRSDAPALFIEKANLFLSALPNFANELDAVTTAMNNNSTNSTSVTSNAIASSGSKTFAVQAGKGYLPGQTIKAASTADGTKWMQGDVTAYDAVTGQLSITMNASQGSGTLTAWTLTLATSVANATGSLTQDYSVKSLTHAIGANIASASTIDLSSATGNLAHLTGNTTVIAATMTIGKDIELIIDSTPQFTYHATNLKLNSGGASITASAGDRAKFSYDGTTVTVAFTKLNGKANVETAAPAGAPVGSGLIHFGSTAPINYLACPVTQTNLNRTTYTTLFAAIGTTWGIGDGSTTFGMPWFAADYAPVQANSNVGSNHAGDIASHTHSVAFASLSIPTHISGASGDNIVGSNNGSSIGSQSATPTGTIGYTGGTWNRAAGSRVLFCVKYQ